MAARVKTHYFSNFNTPRSCVVCGNPPGQGMTWKVSGSKSNWSGKQTTTLSLEFPLCEECHAVSQNRPLAKLLSVLGVLMGIAICLVMAGVVGSGAFENSILGVAIGVALLVGLAIVVRSLSNTVNQRDLTPEQRKRRGLVHRCVRVSGFKTPGLFDKQGWIVFNYENPSFAAEFSTMNLGVAV